jgi:FkbM family methyltransferase
MNTHKIINFLMEHNFQYLSRFIVNILSVVFKSNVKNYIVEGKFWLQKYKNTKFVDFVPNYRTSSYQDAERLCNDIAFSHYKPKSKDICVDIGAGIGTESIFMSELVGPLGKVFSIEAFKDVFDVLNMNMKYNNLHNVNTYNLAISDSNGYVYITDNDNHIENKVVSDNLSSDVKKVKSLTLDKFIKDQEIRQIDFLKVNIEGAEKELIRCFNKVALVKNVAISCHDFLGKRTGNEIFFTKHQVVTFLEENNFIVTTLDTPYDYANDWVFGVKGSQYND